MNNLYVRVSIYTEGEGEREIFNVNVVPHQNKEDEKHFWGIWACWQEVSSPSPPA